MKLQKIYIFILNNLYSITKHVNPKVRNAVIATCFLALAYIYAFIPRPKDAGNRMLFGTVLTIIIIIMSVDRELKPIRWDKYIYLPMVLFGVGILIISRIHPVGNGYLIYAADLIFIFPALYIVWINRSDYELIYDIVAATFAIMGLLAFTYSVILAIRGEYVVINGRASGGSHNPNYLAMTGLSMLLSCEYLVLRTRRTKYLIIVAAIGGIGISMMLEAASRAALISASASTTVLLFEIIKKNIVIKQKSLWLLSKITLVLIVVIAATTIGLMVDDIQANSYQKLIEQNDINSSDYKTEITEVRDKKDYLGVSENAEVLKNRIENNTNNDADIYSSGRTLIWRTYFYELNLLGNDFNQFKKEHPELREPRAHNNILDYAFRLGIPIASLYIIFFVAIGCKALIRMIKCRENYSVYFFAVVITGIYSLYALVEISSLAFTRVIPCLFFMTITPLIGENIRYDG